MSAQTLKLGAIDIAVIDQSTAISVFPQNAVSVSINKATIALTGLVPVVSNSVEADVNSYDPGNLAQMFKDF